MDRKAIIQRRRERKRVYRSVNREELECQMSLDISPRALNMSACEADKHVPGWQETRTTDAQYPWFCTKYSISKDRQLHHQGRDSLECYPICSSSVLHLLFVIVFILLKMKMSLLMSESIQISDDCICENT